MERMTNYRMENKMYCIICGNWFSSVIHDGACPTCSRTIKQLGLNMTHDRLLELAQAEKDGRLVVLPCKVGDTVWVILEKMKPQPARVQGISMSASCSNTILHFGGYPPVSVWGNDIGATWFSTREEAEAALKKREEGKPG